MSFRKGAKCAVYGCKNYKLYKTTLQLNKKSFFTMTRDVNCLKAWILACHRKDLLELLDVKETNYFSLKYVICSDHFEEGCFNDKEKFSRGLRIGSIPTLNLYGDPNNSERIIINEHNKHERNSLDKIDKKHERKRVGVIDIKPERKSLDKIDNKPEKLERNSLNKIDNKPERNSLDKIDNNPERKCLDKVDSNLGESYAEEIKLEEMDLKPLEMILLKPSEDPCIFCGSMRNLRKLHSNNAKDNKMENYLQMISSCFNIKLMDPSGCAGLCETCVYRLRDATSFRAQVEAAGTLLQQIKEEPTNLQTPEQQPTIEDNSSIYEIDEDVDTTFTYADCDTPLEAGSREVLELTWSEDEEAGRRQGRVEWIDQIPKYQKVKSVEPKWIQGTTKCSVCDKEFKERAHLKKHFQLHLPKTLCEICGRQFNCLQTYRLHLGIHLKEHRVSCPQCNASLASRSGLAVHIKATHQGQKLYTCTKGCVDRFGSLYQRNEHLMKKHGIWFDRLECPECSLACFTPSKLDAHVRSVHRKERNVECPECDRVFLNNSLMRQHLKTHSEEKNFVCDLCGKAFKCRKNIRTHLQIHYDIRSNPCPFCDAAFVQISSLKYHMKGHHKDVASIRKRNRMNVDTKKPEIVYTVTYHEDEGKRVDIIM